MSTLVKQVKHPYITIDKKIRGGEPVVAGTGIRVLDIAVRYEIMGMLPEDIIVALPHLNLSQIHDALSYYYEHKQEIDKKWKNAIESVSIMRKAHKSVLEQKLGKVKNIH
jgi:uncharacterized protein (DUF433 family)